MAVTAASTSFASSAPTPSSRIVSSPRAAAPVAAAARGRSRASIAGAASAIANQRPSNAPRSPRVVAADSRRLRSSSSSTTTSTTTSTTSSSTTTATAAVAQAKQSYTTTEGPFAGVTNGDQFAAVLKAGEDAF